MITIIITGPSCSGKSYLAEKLSELFPDTIVINTDSYYRDNLLIRILSRLKFDIYDRPFSFKKKKLMNTLVSIYKKNRLISFYNYDFKKKKSSQTKIDVKYNGNNQFLILEGIFSHRLDIDYKDTINIVCEVEKEDCFKRRLKRDQIDRGRTSREVTKKFNSSWYLFYKNIKKYQNSNDLIALNPSEKISYEKLAKNLEYIKNNN